MVERSNGSAEEAAKAMPKDAAEPLAASKSTKSKPGVTFAAQENLPKLPIPKLQQTCDRYLVALEPLQSRQQRADTKAAVQDFLRAEGPELQDRLEKYATGKSSYIEQFWYDSYLNFDNPVVLNLNPFFLLEDDPTPARNNQVTRAASLVISALAFVRAVRKEELPPDMLRKAPLCMYQYSRLFGTARIPTEHGCQIAQDPEARHIVVLCRGQFYWFDVLDASSDVIMTENDVAQNLQAICNDAALTSIQEAAKSALGVLSTESRKIWSGLRDALSEDEHSNNADCLHIVDSALFILCLDYSEPSNTAQLCMNMLCGTSQVERGVQIGTCTNRWYDKLQIIVCQNGSAGINFEHTGVDGHTVLRFASDLYTDTILRFARSINGQAPSLWASSSPDPAKRDPKSFGDVSTTPHKLEWDMLPELSTAVRFAETRLADLIQQNEFETLDFMAYGKNFMTSMGFSPDAFVQMAYQAAYYGLYGRVECVYEPAMTKLFYHGRTEAIRSLTNESSEFVKIFWGDHAAAKKVEALQKACQQHTANSREAGKAQGQDRHLYALFCTWQRSMDDENEDANGHSNGHSDESTEDSLSRSPKPHHAPRSMPAIFADPGWDKLNTTILSTSNCGNPSLRHFGFGPTSAEGFGIGYIIKDGSVSICASSKHRQTKRFVEAIEAYFIEIRRLLRQTRGAGPAMDKLTSRAREAEEQLNKAGRIRSRGRAIIGGGRGSGTNTPLSAVMEDSDDEGLGGYGFFDAGMLQKLQTAKTKGSQKAADAHRNVGKKLALSDY